MGRKRSAISGQKSAKRQPVDWSKVPVIMTGTANPEGLRLLAESIWEWQLTVDSRESTQVVEDVVDVDACLHRQAVPS
jgi:alkanesulfonate monooxygenase SsuD/methylene tetrahydromethanopterin reductase-like flavin-dependent oxidoreductase (luciferase family)